MMALFHFDPHATITSFDHSWNAAQEANKKADAAPGASMRLLWHLRGWLYCKLAYFHTRRFLRADGPSRVPRETLKNITALLMAQRRWRLLVPCLEEILARPTETHEERVLLMRDLGRALCYIKRPREAIPIMDAAKRICEEQGVSPQTHYLVLRTAALPWLVLYHETDGASMDVYVTARDVATMFAAEHQLL